MSDLTCWENPPTKDFESVHDQNAMDWPVTKAHPDPVLLRDNRVLDNLMFLEDKYTVNSSYFEHVQKDSLKPYMRREVASWMLGVCEDQMCQDEVFPLAMNYMDRFLSIVSIDKTCLQLLGAVCLFLSSKLKESKPMAAEKLCAYTDYSITIDDLMHWELQILNILRWDLSAITACDFLDHILIRLPITSKQRLKIRSHAQTFISLCAIDIHYSSHPASMIAAASIAVAANGLNSGPDGRYSESEILARLHSITSIELDILREVIKQIEQMISSYVTSVEENSRNEMSKNGEDLNSKPETPTDIQDIHF